MNFVHKAGPALLPATIADQQTTSGEVDLGGRRLVGVFTGAGLTGTALTFTAAPASGGTFVPVRKEDGSAYTVTVASSRFTKIDPTVFDGVRFVKVVSGSTESGGDALTLAAR